mgnify:FL=1
MDNIFSILPPIYSYELYVLRYICEYPENIYIIKSSYFDNKDFKVIFNIIKEKHDLQNISKITNTLLFSFITKDKYKYITEIFNTPLVNYEEFKIYCNNLYEHSIKKEILLNVNDFLNTTISQKIDYTQIQELADKIFYSTIQLNQDDNSLKPFEILVKDYEKIIEYREKGIGKKTYGFSSIDNLIIRPASPGEMTTIFGMKGSGKSLFVKCMEMTLVNKGIPVISFNLEMTEESNLDRLLSIETNLSLQDILQLDQNNENKNIILQKLQEQKQKKNYLYYAEPILTLNELDLYIYKAKQFFKEQNVLPEDGYCIVTIDLTEQIEELNGKAGTELKPGVNKLLQIAKKHNIHIINVLQSNENIFRAGKMFSDPDQCDSFTLQPEHVEGGSVYAARSRIVMAINRPLLLKKRFFPSRNEEWDLEIDKLIVRIVKQNDSPKLGQAIFVFGDNSFRLYPCKNIEITTKE